MLRTKDAAVDFGELVVKRFGQRVLAHVKVDKAEIVHTAQRLRGLGTQHPAFDLQVPAKDRLGLRVLGLSDIEIPKNGHGVQCVGMIRTQHPPHRLCGRNLERLGLRNTLPSRSARDPETDCRIQSLRTLRPIKALVKIQRNLQLLSRLRIDPEIQYVWPMVSRIAASTSGLLVKLSGNLRRRPIKGCSYLQVGIRIRRRPRFVGTLA